MIASTDKGMGMNALEQLKDYLKDDAEACELGAPLYHMRAVELLRDHGPALVELIEASEELRQAESSWYSYEVYGEDAPYDRAEGIRRENRLEAARTRQRTALSALTQDAMK